MVIWTKPAKADLTHIYEYIAYDSKHYAKKVTQEIINKVDAINQQPYIGHIVSEIDNENIREFSLYSYRIIYEITQHDLTILTIIHKRKNFKPDDVPK